MPSWKARHSGLEDAELLDLTQQIRNVWHKRPSFLEVKTTAASRLVGQKLYDDNCATCHHKDMSGGIGPSLKSTSFKLLSSDKFLYHTLIQGRPNTAMPSWRWLSPGDLHSLIRILQSREKKTDESQISEIDISSSTRGQNVYHYHCSRCHGEEGHGGIGPAILKRGFLRVASDVFILGMVKSGRTHTPMFSALQDNNDLNDLLHFMRSRQRKIGQRIPPGPNLGDPASGKNLYQKFCSDCHGQRGEGPKAPGLNNQEFLNAATNGYLLGTITMGRRDTPMPRWGKTVEDRRALFTKERHDLVSFIRQWQTLTIKREPTDPIYHLLSSEK